MNIFTGSIVLGLLILIPSLLFDADSDVDAADGADTDFDSDGGSLLQWLSFKAIAAGLIGFGFVGWLLGTRHGTAGFWLWLGSLAGAVLFYWPVVRWLLPWLKSLDVNELQTRNSYQGIVAKVTLAIPAGGKGDVQFVNQAGVYVRESARAHRPDEEFPVGTEVLIVDVENECVVVIDHEL